MRKKLAKLPSPAMAVSFVALIAALTGTAVALPGSNTVTTGDIKGGAVRTSDIKNNNVRGTDIRTSTLRGSDVGANTLTGSDINESTLGTVPSASSAGSAGSANLAGFAAAAGNSATTNGVRVASIRSFVNGTSSATAFVGGGLTLTVDCDLGEVQATTSEDADLRYVHHDSDTDPLDSVNGEGDTFTAGDSIDILEGDTNDQLGQIEYVTQDGDNRVSITFQYDETDAGDCSLNGHALVS